MILLTCGKNISDPTCVPVPTAEALRFVGWSLHFDRLKSVRVSLGNDEGEMQMGLLRMADWEFGTQLPFGSSIRSALMNNWSTSSFFRGNVEFDSTEMRARSTSQTLPLVQQVVGMGFEPDAALAALQRAGWSVEVAVATLLG